MVIVVAIVSAIALSTPAPTLSAPPQIIEVHSQSTLCTTLQQTVGPALTGLMQNDEVIDAGQRVVKKLTHDDAAAAGMDRLQLENASLALVHNLAVIDGLLADAKKFPANPHTDDERTAAQIKVDLQSVVSSQKQKLNEIYGMMDTYELASMRNTFPRFNPTVGPTADDPVPDMPRMSAQMFVPTSITGWCISRLICSPMRCSPCANISARCERSSRVSGSMT